ncbi:DUF6443 domain-containing protein [Sphingobacterium spiritivorum]|uniref:DUF6443 domain-containing protein n=1 Tax=Sphingobacterium spiritivorum TaxID=258 RepID=UPI000E06EBF9|nr:DUF6443 domain-containing protein [Sphingobacterium spiritivorum]QQT34529.1 RHS repeat-associated core domain-containing protein [Sphingobacterium spiritivorum]WQD35398.1 DUF6443 domain-containing protein [Sphingobacterium spiritivorum]SUJ00305.1 RHS repeat-associated core domain [Sphingobacterium spiritivorum]
MKRPLLSTILTLLTLSTVSAQNTDLILTSYSGQSQIKAQGSITLKPGFHIPSGSTVRIYTSSSLQTHPVLQTQPSGNQNYILTRTFRKAGVTLANLSQSRTVEEENQSIQYFDGLGRPLQSIQVMASPTHKDIVQHTEYDGFGRERKKYLPYATSGSMDGSYKPTAGVDVMNFYSPTVGWDAAVKKTGYPYAETQFENSPLNRVQAQGSPGESWQLSSGHTVRTDYGTNETNDVKLWQLNAAENGATATYYQPGRLYKTTIKDENWSSGKSGTVEEYKDFDGRVVLKRVWETESKKLETHYVYDDFGDLRYVIPPAVSVNTFSEDPADPNYDAYIYGYKYDGRRRLTEKKIPGKGKEELVYNNNDQVVLSRDANRRAAGEWLFSKYDAFGRVIMTGIYTSTESAVTLTAQINSNGQTIGRLWENPTTTDQGYTNAVFPTNIAYYHTIHYYDRYDFPENSFGAPTGNQASGARVKTLLTGTKTTTLGTGTMLLTTHYYDLEGRVIQSKSQNHIGGTDITDNSYSFTGELESSTRRHTVNGQTTTITTTNEYDHVGRLVNSRQQLNSQPEVTLLANSYNEIGQLRTKTVGADQQGNNPVNTTDYRYNERGWMTSTTSPHFSQQLSYQDPVKGAAAQWNGNISEQQWGQTTTLNQHFVYSYDKLNRLTNGSSPTSGMSELLNYDDMGNITQLTRDGSGISYTYTGNRLNTVSGGINGSYSYDENGNAKTDRMGMNLSYNHLNIPRQVTGGGNTITYLYDAAGNKLRKTASTSGQRDYAGGIEYQNGVIELIHTAEGVAYRNANGTYSYRYNLTDHLGNVRATIYRNPNTNAVEVLQRDDYYPFGLQKSPNPVYGNNKYLYNGKEKQEELGGQLDYGARFYDPVIGRWNVVDPLAEKYISISPYVYAANNSIKFIDPNGKEIWIYYQDENGDDQKIQYSAGMDYQGRNQFVASIVMALNRMNTVQMGEKLLESIISSDNFFNFKNELPRDRKGNLIDQAEAAFKRNESGGGDILAGNALKSNEYRLLENVSHELFHGYQYENGQNNRVSNEVEAYLFGRSIYQNYMMNNDMGFSSMPWGTSTVAGKIYEESMSGLMYAPSFDVNMFKKAVDNFRGGSTANQDGKYGYGAPVPVTQNPLIKSFYPLIK